MLKSSLKRWLRTAARSVAICSAPSHGPCMPEPRNRALNCLATLWHRCRWAIVPHASRGSSCAWHCRRSHQHVVGQRRWALWQPPPLSVHAQLWQHDPDDVEVLLEPAHSRIVPSPLRTCRLNQMASGMDPSRLVAGCQGSAAPPGSGYEIHHHRAPVCLARPAPTAEAPRLAQEQFPDAIGSSQWAT